MIRSVLIFCYLSIWITAYSQPAVYFNKTYNREITLELNETITSNQKRSVELQNQGTESVLAVRRETACLSDIDFLPAKINLPPGKTQFIEFLIKPDIELPCTLTYQLTTTADSRQLIDSLHIHLVLPPTENTTLEGDQVIKSESDMSSISTLPTLLLVSVIVLLLLVILLLVLILRSSKKMNAFVEKQLLLEKNLNTYIQEVQQLQQLVREYQITELKVYREQQLEIINKIDHLMENR